MLTERSQYSMIGSKNQALKKAEKVVSQQGKHFKLSTEQRSVFATQDAKKKTKYSTSFGQIDGAQIKPPQSNTLESFATSQSKGWGPLHQPKKREIIPLEDSPKKLKLNKNPKYANPLYRHERIMRKRICQVQKKDLEDDMEIPPEVDIDEGEVAQTKRSSIDMHAASSMLSSARKSLADDSPLHSGIRSIDETTRNHSPDLIASQLISVDKTATVQLSRVDGTPRIDGKPYDVGSYQTSPEKQYLTNPLNSDRTFNYKSEQALE